MGESMAERLYVGTRKGLFELAQRGARGDARWDIVDVHFLGDPVSAVLAQDDTVHAALDLGHFGAKLWRRDGASGWRELAAPSFPPKPDDASDDPHPWSLGKIWVIETGGVPGRLWAGTMPGGLFRSDDNGESWALNENLWRLPERRNWFGVAGGEQPGINSVLVDPRNPDDIRVGVSTAGMWASRDGGTSWEIINRGMYNEYMPPELRETPIAQDNFRCLRLWKGREMVRIALREVAEAAPLEETIIELSQLADICLTTVFEHWNNELRQRWGSPASQFAIIGVGKLGGRELNHSSDVDLIFVYSDEGQLTAYPAHLHRMSAALTLQGAVAHCDMPLASGPTMFLPYSQRFVGGYVAFYRPEFIEYFAHHHVQVPLCKGDAVFFNPALYHGAGANTSRDIRRMANLLQVSSPFGRAMESLDRTAMVRAVYPALLAMRAAGRSERELANVVNATAEGYAFPTNLDQDQPIGSLAPPSQVDTVLAAMADGLAPEALDVALAQQIERRIP